MLKTVKLSLKKTSRFHKRSKHIRSYLFTLTLIELLNCIRKNVMCFYIFFERFDSNWAIGFWSKVLISNIENLKYLKYV